MPASNDSIKSEHDWLDDGARDVIPNLDPTLRHRASPAQTIGARDETFAGADLKSGGPPTFLAEEMPRVDYP